MKLVVALFGLMLAIAAVTGFVFLREKPSDCDDLPLEETRSPDGRVGARVYERRCGGERTTRVKLWLVGNPRTPSDIWVVAGAAAPHVHFSDARSLVVEEPAGLRPLLREGAWREVTIKTHQPAPNP